MTRDELTDRADADRLTLLDRIAHRVPELDLVVPALVRIAPEPRGVRVLLVALKDRIFGAGGHWLMGRVMPRQFLDGVAKYLRPSSARRDRVRE
jgi:hypothetical protein